MFRPRREKGDETLPDGSYRDLEKRLREREDHKGIATVVFYPFDSYTDQGPYHGLSDRLASGGVIHYSACLLNAGFDETRVVLRQHAPNVKVSQSFLSGKPIEQVEISAMSIHTADAYKIIEDAYSMPNRPLITLGGPAAKYEPHMFFGRDGNPDVGVDVAVTGEAHTGLALKEMILDRINEMSNGRVVSMREAFEDLAYKRELDVLPGLMYRWKDENGKTWLVDTHVARLVNNLSEYPDVAIVFEHLEKRHDGEKLEEDPLPVGEVKKNITLTSLENTRGCSVHCDYCPLTDGEGGIFRTGGFSHLAKRIVSIFEKTGVGRFFGADDNIGNDVDSLYREVDGLSKFRTSNGKRLREIVRNGTEITLTHLDKFAKRFVDGIQKMSSLYDGVWMGNEDVNQELVRKGQDLRKVRDRFPELINAGIAPNVMNVYGDQMEYTRIKSEDGNQTEEFLRSLSPYQKSLFEKSEDAMKKGKERKSDRLARRFIESLTPSQEDNFKFGLREETFFYLKYGAVSQQFTMLTPATGTNLYEEPYDKRMVMKKAGDIEIESHHFDGNHMVMTTRDNPGDRFRDVIKAYRHMYNYGNFLRAAGRIVREKIRGDENRLDVAKFAFFYQFNGIRGINSSIKTQKKYVQALDEGPIVYADAPPKSVHPILALHPESAKYYSRTSPESVVDSKVVAV